MSEDHSWPAHVGVSNRDLKQWKGIIWGQIYTSGALFLTIRLSEAHVFPNTKGWKIAIQGDHCGKEHVVHTAVLQLCSRACSPSAASQTIKLSATTFFFLRKKHFHSSCGEEALLWTDVFKHLKWVFLKLFSSIRAVLCRSLCWILVISSDYCG